MAQRVEGMNAAFLEMESASMHLHMIGVVIVDPSTAPHPLSRDRLARTYAERLHLIPPFRQRVVTVPGRLDRPMWVEAADFRLDEHLNHRSLGPGATRADLERFVGEVASTPLRRDIPLWETWLVDGFADGTVALISKVHHALMDGSVGGDLMASLFDLEPDPPDEPEEPPRWEGEPSPSRALLLAEAAPAAVRRLVSVPGTLWHTVSSLAGSASAVVAAPASVAGLAPSSPLNGALTPDRTVAFERCGLDDLREIRRAFGATVNDVVLAATTRSLRSYLLERDALPDHKLVASVPVDGRREGEEWGNHTSNMMVALPVHLHDPVDTLKVIHADALGAKAAHEAVDSRVLDEWIELLPPVMLGAASDLYSSLGLGRFHPPLFNVIVSNVAGAPMPLYLAGARVVELYPMGPLIANGGLSLTILSHDGMVDVGVIACPEMVDDVREVADGFAAGVHELLRAARKAEGRRMGDGKPTAKGKGKKAKAKTKAKARAKANGKATTGGKVRTNGKATAGAKAKGKGKSKAGKAEAKAPSPVKGKAEPRSGPDGGGSSRNGRRMVLVGSS